MIAQRAWKCFIVCGVIVVLYLSGGMLTKTYRNYKTEIHSANQKVFFYYHVYGANHQLTQEAALRASQLMDNARKNQ